MNMNKYLTLLACSSLFSICAFSQQTKILTAEKHNEYGIVYSLPTTALQIDVTAVKTSYSAGPYRQYAKKFLGSSKPIEEDKAIWDITSIKVTPIGVKDDDTQYLFQLKAGALTSVGVAENGTLLSINAEPENYSGSNEVKEKALSKILEKGGGVDDYLNYVDMYFVSAQNSMKQAEMIASSLMDVRDAYLSLTRGTADNMPTDGRQLELMLNSLKEQEAAFNRAFNGSVTVEEFSRQFVYIPEKEGEEILFRMSDFNGIVDKDDYSGAPVYIKTEILKEGELPLDANGEVKKFPKDGVVYAIPGTANISIYSGDSNLFDKEMEFAQFGTTFALSPSLFTDKKAPSFARFNPTTGALIEIGKME